MIETSPIDRFLAEALAAAQSGQIAPWPPPFEGNTQSSEALNSFWARIEFHGIAVILHDAKDTLLNWPDCIAERLAEEARLIALWEATHGAALASLLSAFENAGIQSVLMKGTVLAYSLYSNPAARRRGDSDLLIRPSDLKKARSVLESAGWRLADATHGVSYQESWRSKSAEFFVHEIDLHWEPSDRAVLQSVLTHQDFFAERRRLPKLCPEAWGSDPALTLVQTMLNQKWHHMHGYWTPLGQVKGAQRLIWAVDFDLLASAMTNEDWDRLSSFCAARGVGPLVAQSLQTTSQQLCTPLPERRLGDLNAQNTHPNIEAFFATNDTLGEFLLNLRSARSWKERLRMIKDRGFPSRTYLVAKYPDRSNWPTLLLQGRLLIETAHRFILKVTHS